MRVLLFTLGFFAFTANAQVDGKCDDLNNDVRVGEWQAVQEVANNARSSICNFIMLPTETAQNFMRQDIEKFVIAVVQQRFFSDQLVQEKVNDWLSKFYDSKTRYNYPSSESKTFNEGGFDFYIYRKETLLSTVSLSQADVVRCQCEASLDALGEMVSDVYYGGSDETTGNIIQVTEINAQWKSFLEDAREQTYFDITATTVLNNLFFPTDNGSDFNAPPSVQWFFMRPNIVVENVGAAIDGQEAKEAVVLEVIGFNLWEEKSCLGLFSCGFSGTLNYADRAGVDSNGWGVMMHVENAYSIGFSKYGGDSGVFVTVDLLKLFKDKKSTYDRYTKPK